MTRVHRDYINIHMWKFLIFLLVGDRDKHVETTGSFWPLLTYYHPPSSFHQNYSASRYFSNSPSSLLDLPRVYHTASLFRTLLSYLSLETHHPHCAPSSTWVYPYNVLYVVVHLTYICQILYTCLLNVTTSRV